ncbi:MAG: helix-turn-helix domain-containing protein [Faecalibacterium sp.]
MGLSEKIALLRRQQGWSQEELADRLDVSRQAVSKWEGGACAPDLDKVLKLSELFGVSTDYLLKDAPGQTAPSAPAPAPAPVPALRQVSRAEAESYIALSRQLRGRIAVGVGLFILSPAALLQLGAWAEGTAREELAAGTGLILLLVLVALGLMLVIPAGMQLSEYEYLEKESFALEPGTAPMLEQARADYAPTFRRGITLGVSLCVLGVVPLLGAMALDVPDPASVACVDLLLAAVAVAMQLFVRTGMVQGSYDKLLQAGDYTPEQKRRSRRTGWFAGSFWCLTTAVYLGWSFWADAWKTSWIVWPVAGVLFAALQIALNAWADRQHGTEEV